jgi:hypothetical protein
MKWHGYACTIDVAAGPSAGEMLQAEREYAEFVYRKLKHIQANVNQTK